MKIKIETDCKEDEEKIMYHLKRFCRENFQNCKIFIDGELKEKIVWEEKD